MYTDYKDAEIMFHVSTLLPHTASNKQQVRTRNNKELRLGKGWDGLRILRPECKARGVRWGGRGDMREGSTGIYPMSK